MKYLFKAIKDLGIPYEGYIERLNKLNVRNQMFINRAENILNFNIDEMDINLELD